MRNIDLSAVVLGLLFVVLGVAFLLEQLDVWSLRVDVIMPLFLIALGVAVVLGTFARRGQRHEDGQESGS